MAYKLTETQCRALEWLPSDGSWRVNETGIGRSIESLALYHRGTVQEEYGKFGERGGWKARYRLTDAGITLKAEHVKP